MKLKYLGVAVSLSLCVMSTQSAYADEAALAYGRMDYAVAFRLWSQQAANGDPRAQGMIGTLYAYGRGVPRDDKRAVAWFRKAADQGLASAQYALGSMYAQGRGVSPDAALAAAWFRKAADQGEPLAQYALSSMYAAGAGVPRDDSQAASLKRKADNAMNKATVVESGILEQLRKAGQEKPQ